MKDIATLGHSSWISACVANGVCLTIQFSVWFNPSHSYFCRLLFVVFFAIVILAMPFIHSVICRTIILCHLPSWVLDTDQGMKASILGPSGNFVWQTVRRHRWRKQIHISKCICNHDELATQDFPNLRKVPPKILPSSILVRALCLLLCVCVTFLQPPWNRSPCTYVLGGLNDRNWFCHSSEDQKSQISFCWPQTNQTTDLCST